jgi:hypothetical protein
MKKNLKLILIMPAILFLIGTIIQAQRVTAVVADIDPIMTWTHLSSDTGDLDAPTGMEQQTAALIMDIDNDNDNDFVIAGRKGDGPSIVWYRRSTAGWTKYIVENEVLDIEAGGAFFDIDRDGDLDIVMGGDNTTNKIWWWENPAPNFNVTSPWSRYEIKNSGQSKHHDQIFGDFDGDGAAEFVFWNQGDLLTNDGVNGLFIAEIPANPKLPWSYTNIFSGSGEGIGKADIDQDGQMDLLAGGRWFKHEEGTAYTPYLIDAAQVNGRIATADLNSDTFTDVVMVLGDNNGPLKWYSCDGDPTSTDCWESETLLPFNVDHGHSLDIGDLNKDGHLDIFVAEMRLNSGNSNAVMWVFFGDSAGNFEKWELATGVGNHESRLGDLDGDGDLDVLGKPYNWDTPRVDIWLNQINPFLSNWQRHVIDYQKPWRSIFVMTADMNGDGLKDIVTGGWWYQNPGIPSGSWTRHVIGNPLNNMATVYDFDEDGDIDIIGTEGEGSSVNDDFAWAQNDGLGNFSIFENVDSADGKFLQGVTVGRYNGPIEVILSWNDGQGGLQSLTVPSNPKTETWVWQQISPVSLGEALDTADIDHDGDEDISLGLEWLRNDGNGWTHFTKHTPSEGETDRTLLADMDQDGDQDVVIGYGHDPAGKLAWYERPFDPTQPWKEHLIANLVNPQSVSVADMDFDHDLDIVVGEHRISDPENARLFIFENKDGVGGSWVGHMIHVGDEHHDGAQVADLDNDGDLDIFSIGWNHDKVLVYENKADVTFIFFPLILKGN